MNRTLRIDPADTTPIWRQIEAGIRRLAGSGVIAAGSPVPSVRELARELRVNPNTVAKAYQHLAEVGVLEVKRGEGTFVASRPPVLPDGERKRILAEAAARFVTVAATVGAMPDETAEALAEAHRTIRPPEGDST